MSSFDGNFASHVRPILLGEHGQSVTLTSRAGAETVVTAIFAEITEDPSVGGDGVRTMRLATLQVSEDDITPDLRFTATVASEVWDVRSQVERVGGIITLSLVRTGRSEVSHGRYRA